MNENAELQPHEVLQDGPEGRLEARGTLRVAEAHRAPPGKGRKNVEAPTGTRAMVTPQERFLILDTWLRSKLPAKDFAPMVGVSAHSLYKWKKLFEEHGPAGLEDRPRGPQRGSRLDPVTRRVIVRLKEDHPDWGIQRIHDVLLRSEGHAVSNGAIRRVFAEEDLETELPPPKPEHPRKKRRAYRSEFPNDVWQTDLHTFRLKRGNRQLWIVGFLDDHSRFLVGHGLYASQSGQLVRETFKQAIASFGTPKLIQSDRGSQYYSRIGTSKFEKDLVDLGIAHKVVPDPEKNGKIERFWKTLKHEFLQKAVFLDFEDARLRLGHFIGYYNFQRPHQGIDGLAPADLYFQAAPEVLESMRRRVVENARELAQNGRPRKSFYLTGRVGDESISLHAEGEKVVLTKEDGCREEVDLSAAGERAQPGEPAEMPEPLMVTTVLRSVPGREDDGEEWPPGTSPLDSVLELLEEEEDEDDEEATDEEEASERLLVRAGFEEEAES